MKKVYGNYAFNISCLLSRDIVNQEIGQFRIKLGSCTDRSIPIKFKVKLDAVKAISGLAARQA